VSAALHRSGENVSTSERAVTFELEASSVGGMRCEVDVRMLEPFDERVVVVTDELPVLGGEGSAPSPLALFTGALAACLMTQIRMFSKRLRTPVDAVRITGRTQWRSISRADEPYEAEPVGFALDVVLDTEASIEDQRRLIEAAKRGCFIEQTLARPNAITHRLWVGDGWEDI
jgi:uncharacterized OsmC-like protein